MRTAKRIFYVLFAAAVMGVLLLTNLRAYRSGTQGVYAQLRFLADALNNGAALRMQEMFPEGLVFTWALYGIASAQAAQAPTIDADLRAHLLAQSERAVREVIAPSARSTFDDTLDPTYGAFYTSWSLYLLAQHVRAAGPMNVPADLLAVLREGCDRLAAALASSASPFLASYRGQAWPADTAVGIAALGIFDQVVEPRYAEVVAAWSARARERLDPTLGALSHGASATDGEPWGGVRGSSLALMSRVLVDADAELAREQYAVLREHFVDRRLGFPGVREYPRGTEGAGDVDSGPVLLGFSGPAVVVGAAAAEAHGDVELAGTLRSAIEVVGLPMQIGGSRRYGGGLVPIGDAFIAWAWSTPSILPPTADGWPGLVPARWMVPLHLVSIVIAGLVALRVTSLWRRT